MEVGRRAEPPRKRSKTHSTCGGKRQRSVAAHKPADTRVPTYVLVKEERNDLMEEAQMLQTRLELLKLKVGLPTVEDQDSVANVEAENGRLEDEIHGNTQRLARFQSLLSRHLQANLLSPLATFIRLPRDPDKRQAVLEDMKSYKLHRACRLAEERLDYLSPTKPYMHEERFRTPDGLHRMRFVEIQQFRGLRNAKQLYDALMYFQANMEISVSEMIGQLTLREDTEDVDPTTWNHRIVTTGELGGTEELNVAGFARFYESYAPHHGSQFGIVTIDTVDEDELYPYKPLERTRKDMQSVYTVSEHLEMDTQELVVVLKSCAYMTQLPPQFPMLPIVFEKLLENRTRWHHVMNQFLHEFTATANR